MVSATRENSTPYLEWLTSLLITATFGCAVATFVLVMLLHHFVTAVVFLLCVGLFSKAAHILLLKYRKIAEDPQYLNIQWAVISGGLLSVAIAFFATGVVPFIVLVYGGGAMAFLALLSILFEQNRVVSERKAAAKAMLEAENARRMAEEGQYSNVEDTLQEALLNSELAYGSYHPQVATIVTYLAEVMLAQQRMDAATILFKRAVGIHAASRQPSVALVEALQRYGEHLRQKGDLEEALIVAGRAVSESKRLPAAEGNTGRCLILLSRLKAAQGNTKEAYETCRTAVATLEKNKGKSHLDTLQAKGLVANHCITLGRLAEAERIILEVLSEKERQGTDKDAEYLNLLLDLSAVQGSSRKEAALATFQKACEIFRSSVGLKYERSPELFERLPSFLARNTFAEFEPFYSALFAGESVSARKALEAQEKLATSVDASGWTPIQWASLFGRHEIVEELLKLGADQSFGKGTGLPAAYVASRWGQKRVLVSLFQKDADVEIEAFDGSRPLHGAVRSGDQLTFDMLMSRNAQIDATNKRGWTPVHEAAFVGERKFLLQFISKGVDLNFQAPTKLETPLHAAVLGGHWATVETLVLNMADVSAEDADGMTPLTLAEGLGRKEILELLKTHSESPNEVLDTESDSETEKTPTPAKEGGKADEEPVKEADTYAEAVVDVEVENF